MDEIVDPAQWPELTRVRRAVVIVDVQESVRLMQEHEADVIDRWRRFYNEVQVRVLPGLGGRMVKSRGDGMLLEFERVPDAVAAGMELQRRIVAYNRGRAQTEHLLLRMGIHVCDVVVDENDVYGSGVNLADRLSDLSLPGEIVVSAAAYDQLVPDLDAAVEDLGECFLKHVEGTTRAFRLKPPGALPAAQPAPAAITQPSIAVLPFDMTADDASKATVGDVIADGIIAALSRRRSPSVISRLSSSAFKGRAVDAPGVGAALGADYILSGRCDAIDSRLALFAELCEVRSGRVIAADRLVVGAGDPFLPDSEAVGWATALAQRGLESDQLERALYQPMPNLPAYALQLGAVSLMHSSADAGFQRSREMLEHLLARDRRLTTPRAWLAKWHVLSFTRGLEQEREAIARQALDQTRLALERDPDNALCLAVQGFVMCHLRKDFDAAADAFDGALRANPNESLAWLFRGVMHAFQGAGEQAVADTQRALALSPLDPIRYYYLSLGATAALSARDYARAADLAGQSRRLNAVHSSTLRALAIAQVELGAVDAARETVRQLLRLEHSLTVSSYLERLPASLYDIGREWADALQRAGLPS
jgi:adenylate cyclase